LELCVVDAKRPIVWFPKFCSTYLVLKVKRLERNVVVPSVSRIFSRMVLSKSLEQEDLVMRAVIKRDRSFLFVGEGRGSIKTPAIRACT
jgi:hypothetical protein